MAAGLPLYQKLDPLGMKEPAPLALGELLCGPLLPCGPFGPLPSASRDCQVKLSARGKNLQEEHPPGQASGSTAPSMAWPVGSSQQSLQLGNAQVPPLAGGAWSPLLKVACW